MTDRVRISAAFCQSRAAEPLQSGADVLIIARDERPARRVSSSLSVYPSHGAPERPQQSIQCFSRARTPRAWKFGSSLYLSHPYTASFWITGGDSSEHSRAFLSSEQLLQQAYVQVHVSLCIFPFRAHLSLVHDGLHHRRRLRGSSSTRRALGGSSSHLVVKSSRPPMVSSDAQVCPSLGLSR